VTARSQHTATLLTDGRLLVAGGSNATSNNLRVRNSTIRPPARIATGAAPRGENFTPPRCCPAARCSSRGQWTKRQSPARNSYQPPARGDGTGSLATARNNHSATLLPNGKVLAAGAKLLQFSGSAELYDPAAGMERHRGLHHRTLPSHSHCCPMAGSSSRAALTFGPGHEHGALRPTVSTWSVTGSSPPRAPVTPRRCCPMAGCSLRRPKPPAALSQRAGSTRCGHRAWSATGSLATRADLTPPRCCPTARCCASRVAGPIGSGTLNSAELYDPATGTWSATGSSPPRVSSPFSHTTLLPNGRRCRGRK
jgi:hypothetical protein